MYRLHTSKLKEARAKGHYGFEKYTLREIRSFGKEALKRKVRAMPRAKRIKYKKQLKKNQQFIISKNSFGSNEAPPTKAPSMLSCDINSLMFSGVTEPP